MTNYTMCSNCSPRSYPCVVTLVVSVNNDYSLSPCASALVKLSEEKMILKGRGGGD